MRLLTLIFGVTLTLGAGACRHLEVRGGRSLAEGETPPGRQAVRYSVGPCIDRAGARARAPRRLEVELFVDAMGNEQVLLRRRSSDSWLVERNAVEGDTRIFQLSLAASGSGDLLEDVRLAADDGRISWVRRWSERREAGGKLRAHFDAAEVTCALVPRVESDPG